MSELIDNSQQRKGLLKHMILELHKGTAPEQVRHRLASLLREIPYGEVVHVEQELIQEGLPEQEVLKFCDVHTQVLNGSIDTSGSKPVPLGHPVDTFLKENQELLKVINRLEGLFQDNTGVISQEVPAYLMRIRSLFNQLMDVDKHYRRKENLLFPFLEKHGITGPPKVMWGKHDQIRAGLKGALEALQVSGELEVGELQPLIDLALRPALNGVVDMTYKEEKILLPMSLDVLTDLEWYEVSRQSVEIGFCLYDPQCEWQPEGKIEGMEKQEKEDSIQLPSGGFSQAELLTILNSLPVDLTFVDRDNKVKYFSQGKHRIFDRNRAILNRDVRLCHPPPQCSCSRADCQRFQKWKTGPGLLLDSKRGALHSYRIPGAARPGRKLPWNTRSFPGPDRSSETGGGAEIALL
jgi:uncharacterized protein